MEGSNFSDNQKGSAMDVEDQNGHHEGEECLLLAILLYSVATDPSKQISYNIQDLRAILQTQNTHTLSSLPNLLELNEILHTKTFHRLLHTFFPTLFTWERTSRRSGSKKDTEYLLVISALQEGRHKIILEEAAGDGRGNATQTIEALQRKFASYLRRSSTTRGPVHTSTASLTPGIPLGVVSGGAAVADVLGGDGGDEDFDPPATAADDGGDRYESGPSPLPSLSLALPEPDSLPCSPAVGAFVRCSLCVKKDDVNRMLQRKIKNLQTQVEKLQDKVAQLTSHLRNVARSSASSPVSVADSVSPGHTASTAGSAESASAVPAGSAGEEEDAEKTRVQKISEMVLQAVEEASTLTAILHGSPVLSFVAGLCCEELRSSCNCSVEKMPQIITMVITMLFGKLTEKCMQKLVKSSSTYARCIERTMKCLMDEL